MSLQFVHTVLRHMFDAVENLGGVSLVCVALCCAVKVGLCIHLRSSLVYIVDF